MWEKVNSPPYTLIRWTELTAAARQELEEIGAASIDALEPQKNATQDGETAIARDPINEPTRRSVRHLGIGRSKDGWRLFRNVNGRWDERGRFDAAEGKETMLLSLFLENSGVLTKRIAAKKFAKPGKTSKDIVNGPLKAALNKLRGKIKTNAARLLKCSERDIENPIPAVNNADVDGWRIECTLGVVGYDADNNATFTP
ncbi:MAG: hypothetical protein DCC68_22520 [Planctomycetota bacterium]|nr:MAG: hypothetical protein DCC68_22520 [Planctomycetota bacterium]